MFQDVRYGIRAMLQSKGWTAVVLLSLALGIGANTALFSLIDAALLRKLPVEKPDRLVFLDWVSGPTPMFVNLNGNFSRDDKGASSTSFSALTFEKFRENSQTLSHVFASAVLDRVNANIDGTPDLVSGQLVSGNYFGALNVPAIAGRTITEADDQASSEPVAVLSHRYWERRFALDPAVIGKNVVLNGTPVTIIGVSGPGFDGVNGFGTSADFSIPIAFEPQIRRPTTYLNQNWTWWVRVMGRMKPDSTIEQVRAELESTFPATALEAWNSAPEQMRRSIPNNGTPDTPRLRVHEGSRGFVDNRERTSRLLSILMSIFGLLLLIVCANVANLQMARSAARQREIGVRLAMGAGRLRIVRQLLTESVLMAAIAGIAGALLAWWGKDLLAAFLPGSSRMVMDLRIDFRILAFAAATSLLTGILFGIAPALRATRTDVYGSIKETSRTLSRGRSRLGKSLLVVQVAMSVVLLVGAGLFVGTLRNLEGVDVGFNAQNLLLFAVGPATLKYDAARTSHLYDQMIERINALPGVTATTFSTAPLVANSGSLGVIYVQGSDLRPNNGRVRRQTIRENFFETIGIPLLRGRTLSASDRQGAPLVAVVNETLARAFFPDSDPLGRRFSFGPNRRGDDIEIVGIVKDVQDMIVRNPVTPTVYVSHLQQPAPLGNASFEVRTAGDPLAMAPAVREAVRGIDSSLPLFDVKTQVQLIEEGVVEERLLARASSFFGGVALLLACIGLYGVMSYSVTRRTGEIGIRMALGARAPNVVWLVLGETLFLIVIGAVIGLGTSIGLTRLVTRMLFGVAPNDPLTLTVALLLMMTAAVFAGYLPAKRASKVDPIVALRHE